MRAVRCLTGGRRRDERGAVAVEVVLLVPAVLLVVGVLVAGWRLWSARTEVTDAAAAAARAATLTSSASTAQEHSLTAARDALQTLGLDCGQLAVSPDLSGFALPPGTPAEVHVAVDCRVSLSDLLVPGLPGSYQLHARATQPLDTFRERRP